MSDRVESSTHLRQRLCSGCEEFYSGTVSCPHCGHIPECHRMDYVPPIPCRPWRANLDMPGAKVDMTVRHSGQRRLVHKIIRIHGGGRVNA